MATITGLHFYVGPPTGKPPVGPGKPVAVNDGSLARLFRDALLKGPEAFTVHLEIPRYPLLHCNFARCGQSAGLAHWYRGKRTEALTAYLPGLDENDELIVEKALAAKPHPISLHDWYKAMNADRPIYANFLLTPVAAQDALLAQAADVLAFSFFTILGQV